MFIGSFSLQSKWIGLSKRDPKSSVLRRDVESDRLIGNCDESCSSNKITDTISSKIIIFIQAFKMYVSDFVSLRLVLPCVSVPIYGPSCFPVIISSVSPSRVS